MNRWKMYDVRSLMAEVELAMAGFIS